MSEMNDEELQEMMERDRLATTSKDAAGDIKMYSMLFDALAKEPEIPLRHNFAGKVTAAIQAKKDYWSYIKLYALLGLVFIVVLSAVGIYLATVTTSSPQLIQILVKYKWAVVFAGGMLLLIQVLDQKLVKGRNRLTP